MQKTAVSLLAFCVIGCNEYDLKNFTEDMPPGEHTLVECPILEPEIYSPTLTPNCIQEPTIGTFNPSVEWTWNENPVDEEYSVVEAPPIAINLNDDNGDGHIESSDIPDILFPAFRRNKFRGEGHLIALSGATREPLFIQGSDDIRFWGISGIAAGDVEQDGLPDIFAATKDGIVRLTHEGEFVWLAPIDTISGGESIISLADLDGNGISEIIMGGVVLNADGSVRWQAADIDTVSKHYIGAFAADIDQDGYQEVITSGTVFNHDGTVRWKLPDLEGYPALGDLDGDFQPEIISTFSGVVTVLDSHGQLVWQFDQDSSRSGPPTIADFDGDGAAEIGVSSKETYTVLDADGSVLWSQPIEESSSGMTGSSVFDFEGDGAAEVVYADEQTLWIFDGATGNVEMEWTEHRSGTRFEYPTIVDIDVDGSAEILLAGGRQSSNGLSVIGSSDNSWAPARTIWNQYAYSITNINDDGTIPAFPQPSWLLWNSFRAGNSETKVGLELPDIQIGQPVSCDDSCAEGLTELYFPIENSSNQDINQDISIYVQLQNSSAELDNITHLAAQSVYWIGPYSFTKQEVEDGILIYTDTQNSITECREDNNLLLWNTFSCDE